jgi:hypothetical protein
VFAPLETETTYFLAQPAGLVKEYKEVDMKNFWIIERVEAGGDEGHQEDQLPVYRLLSKTTIFMPFLGIWRYERVIIGG